MSCSAEYSFMFWSGSSDYYFELNGPLYIRWCRSSAILTLEALSSRCWSTSSTCAKIMFSILLKHLLSVLPKLAAPTFGAYKFSQILVCKQSSIGVSACGTNQSPLCRLDWVRNLFIEFFCFRVTPNKQGASTVPTLKRNSKHRSYYFGLLALYRFYSSYCIGLCRVH
jgi:hypothetical protein